MYELFLLVVLSRQSKFKFVLNVLFLVHWITRLERNYVLIDASCSSVEINDIGLCFFHSTSCSLQWSDNAIMCKVHRDLKMYGNR